MQIGTRFFRHPGVGGYIFFQLFELRVDLFDMPEFSVGGLRGLDELDIFNYAASKIPRHDKERRDDEQNKNLDQAK